MNDSFHKLLVVVTREFGTQTPVVTANKLNQNTVVDRSIIHAVVYTLT